MKSNEEGGKMAIGETGPIPRPRVHTGEWLVGLGGVSILAGLLLPWAGGENSFEAVSLLKLLVLVVGLAAAAVPAVVAVSLKNDLPIAWETLLSTFATLVVLLLALRLALAPSEGLDHGFFVVAAGCLLTLVAGWLSVSREY